MGFTQLLLYDYVDFIISTTIEQMATLNKIQTYLEDNASWDGYRRVKSILLSGEYEPERICR